MTTMEASEKQAGRAAKSAAQNENVASPIMLPELRIKYFDMPLVSDSPLICHAWARKSIEMIQDKQGRKAKAGRPVRNPEEDFRSSLYYTETGAYGFPSVAFKAAAIRACTQTSDVKMVHARGAFHIDGDMVEIVGTPTMRQDMVRIGMGVADVRYRAEFKTWTATLPIRFNENVISLEQLCNLFNTAGFGVGIGEWRPTGKSSTGNFGMFHVRMQSEI